MKNLVFCFGFLLLAISCNNSQVTSSNTDKMKDFEVLYLSEYGGSGEEKTEVITDLEGFKKFWNEAVNLYSDFTIVPEVDFSAKMVVVQHFRSQNSGGTNYEITSIDQSGNKTEIFYTATAPEGMATMAITSPLMIVVVKKTESPVVEFKKKK